MRRHLRSLPIFIKMKKAVLGIFHRQVTFLKELLVQKYNNFNDREKSKDSKKVNEVCA